MNHPEHWFTKYYQPKDSDIYVEVGASKGETAVLLPASVMKILIDSEPTNIEYLRSLNLENTLLIQTAIASSKGKQLFRVMGAHPNCSRLIESPTHKLALEQNEQRGKTPDWTPEGEPVEWKGYTIEVETDTLESILDTIGIDHVDLLASDCESCEFDMINYAGKWLTERKVKNWAIAAYHIVARQNEIFDKLRENGYRIETDEGGGLYHGDPATGRGQLVIFGLS